MIVWQTSFLVFNRQILTDSDHFMLGIKMSQLIPESKNKRKNEQQKKTIETTQKNKKDMKIFLSGS